MLSTDEVRQTIVNEVRRLLQESGRPSVDIPDDSLLTDDIGLDSLGLASLFIFLEDHFGVDPFSEKFNIVDMRTVADLVGAYGAVLGH